MCGIAGTFGDPDPTRIEKITDALHHRGPDQGGYFHSGDLHLGIRRLSIIDPTGGDQPVVDRTRRKAIVMNGEIYNYRELRAHLIQRGHLFESHCDTEVVLHLFEEYGEECLHRLRGMFAFAIADGDRLFVARDRLGIKPLFYSYLPNLERFLFASEIKALLRSPEVPSDLSLKSLGDSLLMRHTFGSDTAFEHIHSLDPGSTISIRRGSSGLEITHKKYYQPSADPLEDGRDFEASIVLLRAKLEETVEAHLVSDVEVGILLSGGIDSSLLAAIMSPKVSSPLRAFTVAPSEDFADLQIARGVAAGLNASHEILHPGYEDYVTAIPSFVLAMESFTRLAGLSAFLLCRHVGRQVKVCLNGESSDEIFGGYAEFLKGFPELDHLSTTLERIQAVGLGSSPELRLQVRELLRAKKEGPAALLEALFRWHLKDRLVQQHLHFMDRIGMAASLEIRVPFVDHELVEMVTALPVRFKVDLELQIQKYILKRVALDGFGSLLSAAVLRSKTGFPAADGKFQSRFGKMCHARLGEKYLHSHPLGPAFQENSHLLLFELFHLIFVENRGVVPAGFNVDDFITEKASRSKAISGKSIFVLAGSRKDCFLDVQPL